MTLPDEESRDRLDTLSGDPAGEAPADGGWRPRGRRGLDVRMERLETRMAASRERAWAGESGAHNPTPKAGRNLPLAILSGAILGGALIACIVLRKELFLVLATLAVGAGAWELRQAFTRTGYNVPLIPAVIGAPAMMLGAYLTGGHGLAVAFGATLFLAAMWRAADRGAGRAADVCGSFFIASYPCLLAGFSALLLAPEDGNRRLLVYLLVTVTSDIGGYAVGLTLGRHPMAPSVSPKKSWEGFAGSVVFCMLVGVLTVTLALHGSWLAGAVLGALTAALATLGDLFESLIKRDLGIKDMSNLIPGHGGAMDRLDSLVLTAPLVWFVLAVMVPVGGA